METKDKIQVAALILLAILIVVLIMAIVVLAKNVEEIKSDPVAYAINNDFYDSCSCYNEGDINYKGYDKQMVIQNWTS